MTLTPRSIIQLAAVAATLSVAAACSDPKPPTNIASTTPTSLTAGVNSNVSVAPAVKVSNKDGDGVGGVAVTFAVTAGGGTLGAASVMTGDDGTASAGSWKLGTTAGANTVTASVEGLTGSPVTFSATGTAGVAAKMTLNAGDAQTATVNTSVIIKPSVKVFDVFDNPVPNATVTFSVTAGGGIVSGGTATTTSTGLATVGSWTLGASPGANTLSATVFGVATPIVFNATGEAATAALVASISAGDKQANMVSTAVGTAPAVLVTSNGSPMPGVSVTFSVLTGGGSVTGATATTNASGIATVGSWTLGSVYGLNTLQTTVAGTGVTGNPITFTASGCDGVGAGYRITVCFTSDMTASQKATVQAAMTRWEGLITGDVTDVSLAPSGVAAGSCGGRAFALPASMIIDDLLVFANTETVDGSGGVLASASPCLIRNSNSLTVVGTIRFDIADFGSPLLNAVTLHEMGHVFGVGTLWSLLPNQTTPFLQNAAATVGTQDTYFSGTNAVAAFNAAGGNTYVGNKVPVENCNGQANCGAGTINSHWREGVLGIELMTGFIGTNAPLSAVTLGSLQDLGYTVNMAGADAWSLGATVMAPGAAFGPLVRMVKDIDSFPIYSIDARGVLKRIR